MKKQNFLVQTVSNLIIIMVLVALSLFCIPKNEVACMSPIYKVDTNENKVGIMFNVYQGSEYLPRIIEILNKNEATCTFFLGGIWAEKNTQLIEEMGKVGEIGNHGYLHKDHAKLSLQQNKEEILLCNRLLEEITGTSPTLFAPPSGSIGDNMTKVCIDNNMTVVMWSKDTIDWRDNDYKLILERATNDIQNGDMVLMHPTEATLKALPLILKCYKDNGLTTDTISNLIANKNKY
ncbi:MAG: polysaccharide deacetylase family protein [Clostridia bacterium]